MARVLKSLVRVFKPQCELKRKKGHELIRRGTALAKHGMQAIQRKQGHATHADACTTKTGEYNKNKGVQPKIR